MLEPQPLEPKYWKALLFVGAFTLLIAWFLHPILRLAPTAWAIVLPIFIVGASGVMHHRMKNDWRAQDTMNMELFDRRTAVGRNVTIKD